MVAVTDCIVDRDLRCLVQKLLVVDFLNCWFLNHDAVLEFTLLLIFESLKVTERVSVVQTIDTSVLSEELKHSVNVL